MLRLSVTPPLLGLAAALAVAVVVAAPGTARAQSAAKPPPAGQAESTAQGYQRHMENGVRLYADRNYRAAIAEFEASYAAHPKANPLINLALCYKAEFRYPKAIEVLEKALTKHLDTMDEADRKAALDGINEMKALLAHVRVTLVPSDAALTVDGDPQPAVAARAPVAVGPGAHTFAAARAGYEATSQQVSVVSGDDKQITLTLRRNAAGTSTGEPAAAAGSSRHSTALMVIGIAAGGLGILAGGTGLWVFQTAGSENNTACPGNENDPDFCESPDAQRRTGVGLLVLGGALLAGGIPMFIIGVRKDTKPPPATALLRPEVRIAPSAGALRWTF